jgi:hypothetical protein
VVETVGLELVTHHPVIEPFSGQGRERNFRPRDRGENALYLLAETKCRDSHRYEKPLFRGDSAARSSPHPEGRVPKECRLSIGGAVLR